MRAYVVAMTEALDGERPVRMAPAVEESPIFLTRAKASQHITDYGFAPERWTVRAVNITWARRSSGRRP
jgi:hypothetical protein